jgi:hypothetical protein
LKFDAEAVFQQAVRYSVLASSGLNGHIDFGIAGSQVVCNTRDLTQLQRLYFRDISGRAREENGFSEQFCFSLLPFLRSLTREKR